MLDNFRTAISNFIAPKASGIRQEHRLQESPGQVIYSPTMSGGDPPKLGTKELLESYSTMPWLRAVVNKVGKSVGATNWKLFVLQNPETERTIRSTKMQRASSESRKELIKKEHQKGDLREIEDHPILDLLYHGNPRLLGNVVFQLTQQHIDLAGEAFWMIERNMFGTPVAVWPLPPDWVEALPTADDPTYRIRLNTQRYAVPVTEVIVFLDPDPADPYSRGTGVARALGDELETDEFAAKHTKSFFFNRARPDFIISADNLGPADTKRMEERWLEKHRGFWNRYKPHFLNRKVDVHQLSQSFEEMQLMDLRKHERDTIIQVFGAPPEKLGILTASNRATITSADMFWTKDIIMPRVELLRATLQEHLVPMFDDRLILDFESPVMQDKEHQLNIMRAMPSAFTVNEWRDEADREPLGADGEVFPMRPGEEMRLPIDEVDQLPNPDQPNPDPDDHDEVSRNLASGFRGRISNEIKEALARDPSLIRDKIREKLGTRK